MELQGRKVTISADPNPGRPRVVPFSHTLRLGPHIDAEAVTADMEDGVLSLHFAYRKDTPARRIEVQAGGGTAAKRAGAAADEAGPSKPPTEQQQQQEEWVDVQDGPGADSKGKAPAHGEQPKEGGDEEDGSVEDCEP